MKTFFPIVIILALLSGCADLAVLEGNYKQYDYSIDSALQQDMPFAGLTIHVKIPGKNGHMMTERYLHHEDTSTQYLFLRNHLRAKLQALGANTDPDLKPDFVFWPSYGEKAELTSFAGIFSTIGTGISLSLLPYYHPHTLFTQIYIESSDGEEVETYLSTHEYATYGGSVFMAWSQLGADGKSEAFNTTVNTILASVVDDGLIEEYRYTNKYQQGK
ncbi:hypothetical protein OAV62_00330 [bacterium]|nr:hypothetical protein [bacterium]